MADQGGDGLLLSYEAGNHLHRYGGRVFADGRYELFTASGQERPKWTAYEPFTPDQVREIRGAVDEALAAELPSRVTADPPPLDAPTAHFTLGDREIVVADWPANAPPELERLLERIARAAPPPARAEHLGAVDREGAGRARGALRDRRGGPAGGAARRDLPAEPAVLARSARHGRSAGGDPARAHHVRHGQGRRGARGPTGRPPGRPHAGRGEQVQSLDADRMAAIRHALAAEDWAALPARLC